MEKHGLQRTKKEEPYSLTAFDERLVEHNNGWVLDKTKELPLKIGSHEERISFDISGTTKDEIVLGRPWLKKHNPQIDWTTEEMTFARCSCPSEWNQTKPKWSEHLEPISINELRKISRKKKTIHRIIYWDTDDPKKIPEQYRKYNVFKEPKDIGLPEHKPWDHEIPLKEGKQPTFKPLFRMNSEQQEAVREYVEEGLRK